MTHEEAIRNPLLFSKGTTELVARLRGIGFTSGAEVTPGGHPRRDNFEPSGPETGSDVFSSGYGWSTTFTIHEHGELILR
jgi:hypothetical protein